jgi:hypothetical protein
MAQTSYAGLIGKSSVEFVVHIYTDGDVQALYAYTKYNTPIELHGAIKQKTLTFYEKDSAGKNKAIISFKNFDQKSQTIAGSYKNLKTNTELAINLSRSFDIDFGDSIEWKNRELIQLASFADKYLKLVVSKTKGNFSADVTGIKIFEKSTNRLIQHFDIECELRGLHNVKIDDYNFDGIPDFAVFEQSYAGPNTSSLYFLYDPKTKKFFQSSFEGTSLEFDKKEKRIYERNQCCAGRSIMNAEYKVKDNKMVLLKKKCTEYDEKKKAYITVKCE